VHAQRGQILALDDQLNKETVRADRLQNGRNTWRWWAIIGLGLFVVENLAFAAVKFKWL
jgi:hypothetical protein